MNIPFFLHQEKLSEKFLWPAEERGLLQLKGYITLGGVRASLYNAMPIAGSQALLGYMRDFEIENA